MYVFIQVKADQFVGYEAMAQKLCEVSLSLTLYPPGMNAPPCASRRAHASRVCALREGRWARAQLEAAVLAGLGRDGPCTEPCWGLANSRDLSPNPPLAQDLRCWRRQPGAPAF